MRRLILLVVFLAVPMAAQTVSYTRFLLPVVVGRWEGAYGSSWRSEAWLVYTGTAPAVFIPAPVCYLNECPAGVEIPPGLPPWEMNNLLSTEREAVLLHVDSRYAANAAFALRVRDLSHGDSAGTEIPVVREDRILSQPVYLQNVPLRSLFRVTLRVYALPEVANPVVQVRYYRMPVPGGSGADRSLVLLRSDTIELSRPQFGEPAVQPSYAQVGNVETFPQLAGENAVFIEIVPVTPSLRIWAMASVTNNQTQQATVISP